jgi:hypothetical protein
MATSGKPSESKSPIAIEAGPLIEIPPPDGVTEASTRLPIVPNTVSCSSKSCNYAV